MRGKAIRRRLHSGERVYGTLVTGLTNPNMAAMQAGFSYDFIFICTEHMPLDRSEMAMMCEFYAAHGISPVVRILYPAVHHATMALDAGAEGIVAPYVETVEQVKDLVGAVKYRPLKGQMLRDILSERRELERETVDYLTRCNRHSYAIIGIESMAAYEKLDSLLAVKQLDGVFVGPHDLSVTMELPEDYEHPEFQRVVKDIVKQCRARSLGVGVHWSPDSVEDTTVEESMRAGMNWVLYGADITELALSTEQRFATFRRRMRDTYQRDAD